MKSNIKKYVIVFFIGSGITVIGGFFTSIEKNGVSAVLILIGGLVATIIRFLLQMDTIEIGRERHEEITKGVENLRTDSGKILKTQKAQKVSQETEYIERKKQIKSINQSILRLSDNGRVATNRDSITIDNLGDRIILKEIKSENKELVITFFKNVPIEKNAYFNILIETNNGDLPVKYNLNIEYESFIGDNEQLKIIVKNNCRYIELQN
jgi:hypothetical protein